MCDGIGENNNIPSIIASLIEDSRNYADSIHHTKDPPANVLTFHVRVDYQARAAPFDL
jgi:hypothetical protein